MYLCAVGDDGKPGGVSLAGHACRVYARSPFVRIPVAAAIQDITVETGPGSYDLTVEKVRLVRGVETTLALTGPTLSPRLARDQLSLRDETGAYVVQGELSKRKLWGLPVLALVGALLLLAAIAKSVRTAKDELSPLGVSALGVVAAAVLAERLSFLAGLSTAASVVLALGGGVFALWMAARAAHAEKLNAALFQIAAAQLGVVLIGLSAESDSLALLHVAVTSLSLGAIALLAHGVPGELEAAAGKGARSRARAAQVAAAVATGAPLPLVGIVWARDAMGRAVFATEGGPVPTWVPYVLMMLTATVAAFATWRVVLIVRPAPDQQKKTDKGDAVASIGMALAGVAGAMGLLGISGPIVAGKASVIATTPLMAEASPMVHSVGMALTAIALGCSLVGWILARQRYRGEWQKREARRPGHGLLSRESFGPVPLAAVAEAAGAAVVQLTCSWRHGRRRARARARAAIGHRCDAGAFGQAPARGKEARQEVMRRFIAFFVVLSVLLTTAVCFAGAPVKVHPLRGPAPARMVAEDGDWVTHFVVENVSGGPVQIQELRLLGGDEHDPLLPRGMKVAFTDGSPHGRLAAGESKEGSSAGHRRRAAKSPRSTATCWW